MVSISRLCTQAQSDRMQLRDLNFVRSQPTKHQTEKEKTAQDISKVHYRRRDTCCHFYWAICFFFDGSEPKGCGASNREHLDRDKGPTMVSCLTGKRGLFWRALWLCRLLISPY